MQILVNGKKKTLTQKNYVTKGGEGQIFKSGAVAYKIYEDIRKMIPAAKIKEYQVLDLKNIVKPKDLIYDLQKHEIGFTMDWLGGNTVALCKLFTNTFRDNNGIDNDRVIELVENMKKVTQYIHDHNFLIVDGNELNYLVADDFITPYFIDVNSWKSPSFQATAIMPSIRDWSIDTFSPLTDWFSFAVVTFQLFVGLHPFKGKHKEFRKNDFRKRVRDCISVFNSSVSLPPTTRDFNLIPSAYKDWYYQMFENGQRKEPPQLPGTAGLVQVQVYLIQSTDNFEIRELREFTEDILYHDSNLDVTKTKGKIYLGKTDYSISPGVEVIFTPLENIPILIKIENHQVKFNSLTYPNPEINIECTDMMIVDNTLFLKNKEKLMEMTFKVFNGTIHPVIKTTWNIEPNSSVFFSNVIVQSVLGKTYLAIPIPQYDKSSFIIKAIPELNDYKIIEAKYENKICVLTGHKGSVYSRIILIFDEKFNKYKCRIVDGIDYSIINFTTLANGVCVMITDDDAVEIFSNRIDKDDVKRIEDPVINSTMNLCKDGVRVKFFRENKLFEIKMK